ILWRVPLVACLEAIGVGLDAKAGSQHCGRWNGYCDIIYSVVVVWDSWCKTVVPRGDCGLECGCASRVKGVCPIVEIECDLPVCDCGAGHQSSSYHEQDPAALIWDHF